MTKAGRQPVAETAARGDLLLVILGVATLAVYIPALLLPFSVFEHGAMRLLSFAGETGRGAGGFVHYLSALGVPFLLYLAALAVCLRWKVSLTTVLVFSGLFGTVLVLVYPLTAIDAFAYAAQTRLFTEYGSNPHTVPANTFVSDPFLQWAAFLDRPSPYGPMWTYIASVPTLLGGDEPMRAALGMKALALASHLASTVLAYLIAHRWRPGSGPLAALLLGWNPLVLWSSAGDGHNDAVMMTLVLLAVFLLQRRPVLGVPTLVLAGMVKFVALALGPIFLLYLWRRGESPRLLAGTLAISAALAVVVVAPFWEGTDTLDGLRPQGSMETMSLGGGPRHYAGRAVRRGRRARQRPGQGVDVRAIPGPVRSHPDDGGAGAGVADTVVVSGRLRPDGAGDFLVPLLVPHLAGALGRHPASGIAAAAGRGGGILGNCDPALPVYGLPLALAGPAPEQPPGRRARGVPAAGTHVGVAGWAFEFARGTRIR